MSKSYEERLACANGVYAEGLRRVATTPVPKGQKFKPGTFVQIASDLGPCMSHFEKDRPAMVEHTYKHAYGGDGVKEYSLLVRYDDGTWSSVAWYEENQLTKITNKAKLKQYRKEIGSKK